MRLQVQSQLIPAFSQGKNSQDSGREVLRRRERRYGEGNRKGNKDHFSNSWAKNVILLRIVKEFDAHIPSSLHAL